MYGVLSVYVFTCNKEEEEAAAEIQFFSGLIENSQ